MLLIYSNVVHYTYYCSHSFLSLLVFIFIKFQCSISSTVIHNTVHAMIIMLPIFINLILCILLFIVYCVHVQYVRFDMCKINEVSQSVTHRRQIMDTCD